MAAKLTQAGVWVRVSQPEPSMDPQCGRGQSARSGWRGISRYYGSRSPAWFRAADSVQDQSAFE